MIIIVDAYNVLKQAFGATMVTENTRNAFIEQLSRYSKKKGHALIVVFDGGPYERSCKELVKGIKVVYSGIGESADQWIKKYISQHKSYDLLLVSTDRELGNYAARFSIQSLDSLDFYSIVKHELGKGLSPDKKQSYVVKVALESCDELDELMRSATVSTKTEDKEFAQATKERNSSGNKLSKKERTIINKIKKL